jgi:hypothetical protein
MKRDADPPGMGADVEIPRESVVMRPGRRLRKRAVARPRCRPTAGCSVAPPQAPEELVREVAQCSVVMVAGCPATVAGSLSSCWLRTPSGSRLPSSSNGHNLQAVLTRANWEWIRAPSMNPPDSVGVSGQRALQSEVFETANTSWIQGIRLFPATMGSVRQAAESAQSLQVQILPRSPVPQVRNVGLPRVPWWRGYVAHG